MIFGEKTIEKVASVSGGAVWLSQAGGVEAGVLTGVALAGIAALGIEAFAQHGPESAQTLARIQRRTLQRFDEWSERRGAIRPEAVAAADEALSLHLFSCFPSREEIAALAANVDGFPAAITQYVSCKLAALRPDVFPPDSLALEAAEAVIEAALRAAIDDRAYFAKLQPHLVFEQLRQSAVLLDAMRDVQAAQQTLAHHQASGFSGVRAGLDEALHMLHAILVTLKRDQPPIARNVTATPDLGARNVVRFGDNGSIENAEFSFSCSFHLQSPASFALLSFELIYVTQNGEYCLHGTPRLRIDQEQASFGETLSSLSRPPLLSAGTHVLNYSRTIRPPLMAMTPQDCDGGVVELAFNTQFSGEKPVATAICFAWDESGKLREVAGLPEPPFLADCLLERMLARGLVTEAEISKLKWRNPRLRYWGIRYQRRVERVDGYADAPYKIRSDLFDLMLDVHRRSEQSGILSEWLRDRRDAFVPTNGY